MSVKGNIHDSNENIIRLLVVSSLINKPILDVGTSIGASFLVQIGSFLHRNNSLQKRMGHSCF